MTKTSHTEPLQEDVWSCMEDYLINTYDELHSAQYNDKHSHKTNSYSRDNDREGSNASSKVHMRSKMDWYAFVYDVCHGDPLRTRELYIRVALTILHALEGCVLFPLLRQISKEMPIEVVTDKNKSYQLGLSKRNTNKQQQRQMERREEINTRSTSTRSFTQTNTPEKDSITNARQSTQVSSSSSTILHEKEQEEEEEEEEEEETLEQHSELSSSWSSPSSSTNSFSLSLFHRSRMRNKESFSFMRRVWGKHRHESESDQDEYNKKHQMYNNKSKINISNNKCRSADDDVIEGVRGHIVHHNHINDINKDKTNAHNNNNNVQRELFTAPHHSENNYNNTKNTLEPVQRVRLRQQVKQWISQKLHNTTNHFLNHITLSTPEEAANETRRRHWSTQKNEQQQELSSLEYKPHEPQREHDGQEQVQNNNANNNNNNNNTNICTSKADKEKESHLPICHTNNTELPSKNIARLSSDAVFRSSDRECSNELLLESNRRVTIKPQTSNTITFSAASSSSPESPELSKAGTAIEQQSLPSHLQHSPETCTQRESSLIFSPLQPSRNTSELLDLSSTIHTDEVTRTNSTNSFSFKHYTNWPECTSRSHNAYYDRLLDVFMNECDVFSNFTVVVKSSFGYLDQYFTRRVGIDTIEMLCVKLYYRVVYLPLQQLLTQSLLYNVSYIRRQRWCNKQIDEKLHSRIELVNDYINFVIELLSSVTEHSSFVISEDLEEEEEEECEQTPSSSYYELEEQLEMKCEYNTQEKSNDEICRVARSNSNLMQSAKLENLQETNCNSSQFNANNNNNNNAQCYNKEEHEGKSTSSSCYCYSSSYKGRMEENSTLTNETEKVMKRTTNSLTQGRSTTVIINLQSITQLRTKLETGSLAQHLSSAELYKRAKLQEKHQQQQHLSLFLSLLENEEPREIYTPRSITASIILNVKVPLPVLLSRQLGARYITQLREFYNYMAKIRLMRHNSFEGNINYVNSNSNNNSNNTSVMSYVSWVYQVMSMEMHLLPNLELQSYSSEPCKAYLNNTNNENNENNKNNNCNCEMKTPLENVTSEFICNVRDALVETLVHNVHRRIILDKHSGFAQLLKQWEKVYMKCTIEQASEYYHINNKEQQEKEFDLYNAPGQNMCKNSPSSCCSKNNTKLSDTGCDATNYKFASWTCKRDYNYCHSNSFSNNSQHLQSAVNAIKRFVTIFTLSSSSNDTNDIHDNGMLLLSSILATHVISRGAAFIEEYLEQCVLYRQTRLEERKQLEDKKIVFAETENYTHINKKECKKEQERQACDQEVQNSDEIHFIFDAQYKLVNRLLALYKMHVYLIDMCFTNKGKHHASDSSNYMNVNIDTNNINNNKIEKLEMKEEVEYSSVLMRNALNDAFKVIVNPRYWGNVETFLTLQLQKINDEDNRANNNNNNTKRKQSAHKRNKKRGYEHGSHTYESTNSVNNNDKIVPSVLLHRDAGVKALSPLMHLAERPQCVELNFSTMCNDFIATYIEETTNIVTHHYAMYEERKDEDDNNENNMLVMEEGRTLHSLACIVALLEDENEFVAQYSYSLAERLLLLHHHNNFEQRINANISGLHFNECDDCCSSYNNKMKLDKINAYNLQHRYILVKLWLENMFVNALQLELPASSLQIHRLQEMIHDIHKSLVVNSSFQQDSEQKENHYNSKMFSWNNFNGEDDLNTTTIHFSTHILNSAHWLSFTPQYIYAAPTNFTLHKDLHEMEVAFAEHYKKLHPSRLLRWHHLDNNDNNSNANNVKLQIVISEEHDDNDDGKSNNRDVSYTITTSVIQATILLHLQDALVKSYNAQETDQQDHFSCNSKQREHVESEEQYSNTTEKCEWLTGEELSEQLHMPFDELRPYLFNLLMPLGLSESKENTHDDLSSRLVLRMSGHDSTSKVSNMTSNVTDYDILHSIRSNDCFVLNCNFTSERTSLCIPSDNFVNKFLCNSLSENNNKNYNYNNTKTNINATASCLQLSPTESSLLAGNNNNCVNNISSTNNTLSLTGPQSKATCFPRKTLIEMQVMHEFKQHHKLTLVELYVKVKDQLALHFIPTVMEVKERLEKLVEREYIQRSSTHHNVFKYVP